MKTQRLQNLFGRKHNDILSVYFTAGFPSLGSTGEIITSLVADGVDMIEVGAPFSDPMADGKVIQGSSTVALRNGMTLSLLLDQVEEVRPKVPDTPLILMGYLNPMMRFGIQRLFERCAKAGIDALIIPDLPFADYLRDFKQLCDDYSIPVIMLVTPETSAERIRLIDQHCDGFIYAVSTASTTGTRDSFTPDQVAYFTRLRDMNLRHPFLIGFGISNPATFRDACDNAAGAIIGSKFIRCLEASPTDIPAAVNALVSALGLTR